MSLYNSFDRAKHFSELDSPLDTAEGVLSPSVRRERCIENLMEGGIAASNSRFTIVTGGTTALRETRYNGIDYLSIFDLTAFSLGNGGDAASLGIGAALLTVTSGVGIMIENASMTGAFSSVAAYTDTPDAGLGTVVASGAVAVLGGTATFENIIGGVASAALNAGGAYSASTITGAGGVTNLALVATNQIFVNAAAAWDDVAAAQPILFTGVVSLKWRPIMA